MILFFFFEVFSLVLFLDPVPDGKMVFSGESNRQSFELFCDKLIIIVVMGGSRTKNH
jgi:hypothetical protein